MVPSDLGSLGGIWMSNFTVRHRKFTKLLVSGPKITKRNQQTQVTVLTISAAILSILKHSPLRIGDQ